jgi:hypothetical protein
VARRTRLTDPPPEPDWVTVAEAARRLGMSGAWLRGLAKSEGIRVVRRGGRPGVDWTTIEVFINRSRITRAGDSSLQTLDPERRSPGVAVIEKVKVRFD